MASVKDVVNSYSALHEMGICVKVIQPTMTDPNIAREEKRATLNTLVQGLTEKTFKNGIIANQIMVIINMKEDVCKEYEDTESQVNGILSWLPRMEFHKNKLIKAVKKNRLSYGLKV